MEPLSNSNIISLISLGIGLLGGWIASYRAGGVNQQRIADKLDQIARDCSDTRGELKELNRQLADHTTRLVKCEEQIVSLFNRLERLESAHDMHHGAGGTD